MLLDRLSQGSEYAAPTQKAEPDPCGLPPTTHIMLPPRKSREECPQVKYWFRTDWATVQTKKGNARAVKEAKEPEDLSLPHKGLAYITDINGVGVTGYRAKDMRETSRALWVSLNKADRLPLTWGDIDSHARAFYRTEMYGTYPDLMLCEAHWKLDLFASRLFPSCDLVRRAKAAHKQFKTEDGSMEESGKTESDGLERVEEDRKPAVKSKASSSASKSSASKPSTSKSASSASGLPSSSVSMSSQKRTASSDDHTDDQPSAKKKKVKHEPVVPQTTLESSVIPLSTNQQPSTQPGVAPVNGTEPSVPPVSATLIPLSSTPLLSLPTPTLKENIPDLASSANAVSPANIPSLDNFVSDAHKGRTPTTPSLTEPPTQPLAQNTSSGILKNVTPPETADTCIENFPPVSCHACTRSS